jgi:hypothetical protein
MGNLKEHPLFEKMVRDFASNEPFREKIKKPICFPNGWVGSTNSHKLLWFYDPEFVKKEDIFNYEKGEGADAETIMKTYGHIYNGETKPIGKISLGELSKIYLEIRKVPEFQMRYRDCEQCDGSGLIECYCCGVESDCEECDGSGEISLGEHETGYFKYPNDTYLKLEDNYLSLFEFGEILEFLTPLDIKELDVYFTNDKMKVLFGIPNESIYILLMGVYLYGDNVEKVYDIFVHSEN